MDPTKGDMVAALCDSLGENAGKIMHRVYIHQIEGTLSKSTCKKIGFLALVKFKITI